MFQDSQFGNIFSFTVTLEDREKDRKVIPALLGPIVLKNGVKSPGKRTARQNNTFFSLSFMSMESHMLGTIWLVRLSGLCKNIDVTQ